METALYLSFCEERSAGSTHLSRLIKRRSGRFPSIFSNAPPTSARHQQKQGEKLKGEEEWKIFFVISVKIKSPFRKKDFLWIRFLLNQRLYNIMLGNDVQASCRIFYHNCACIFIDQR